ncbi:MAG TPA: HD domain-containing phosphohydrolase [Thermoanaerobaculia bacterium]|jgi:HD-GYP domain-containing protein (c-di-GMP phosphodiesterase class II)
MSEDSRGPKTQRVTIDDLALRAADDLLQEGGGPNAVLHAWFQLFRTAQIHAIDNQALQRPIAAMVEMTATLVPRDGRVSFQTKDKSIFVNGVKLRLSTDEYALSADVFNFFEERGIGGFTIDKPLTAEITRKILSILVYGPIADRKFEKLDAALKAAGVPFKINKPLGATKSSVEVALERRSYTFFTYSKLVVLYRSLIAEEKLNAQRRVFYMKKIARTVQALVDICLEDDHTFLGASSVKSGEAYAPHHAANVAILSIAIGEKLGLSKVDLADLGLAAVFHDVGMRSCPSELLEKPKALDANERMAIEQHPLRSVEYLLQERSFSKSVLSRIVVAFEHHRAIDGSGYPFVSRRPDLFSRIVAIADAYDAMTTHRPWRKAVLPDEALGAMMRGSGQRFDAALLSVFINTIGLYPVGTLVRLDTGELGVVVYGGGEGERVSRPIVALLGRDGKPAGTIDLAERDGSGTYKRSVVASEDPAKYGVQTSGFVAGSAVVTN